MLTISLCLVLAVPVQPGSAPDGPQLGTGSAVADALRRSGYQPIPLRRFRGQLMLDTTYAGKPLALMVDTGAASSCMDLATAPGKYGVKVIGRGGPKLARVGGEQDAAAAAVVGLKLTGIECPPIPWFLTDLSVSLEFSKRTDNLGGDALLGMDLLGYFSAWVDTQTATLWLLDPMRVATDLQGEWRAVAVEHRSKPFSPEYVASYSLVIDGIDVTYRADGTVRKNKAMIDPSSTPKSLDLVSADGGRFPGIYRVAGDELVYAAGLLQPDDNTKRPTSFDHKTNGATVVTYRRVKPANADRK